MIKRVLFAILLPVLAYTQASAGGNVENGKRLYVKDGCYECHGYAGQGGAGARLAPKVLPAAALIAYVRHPRAQCRLTLPRWLRTQIWRTSGLTLRVCRNRLRSTTFLC